MDQADNKKSLNSTGDSPTVYALFHHPLDDMRSLFPQPIDAVDIVDMRLPNSELVVRIYYPTKTSEQISLELYYAISRS